MNNSKLKLLFKLSFLTGILCIAFFNYGFDNSEGILTSRVRFADISKAKELLKTEDEYTDGWSQFDIDSRLQKNNSTKDELLKFLVQQTEEWTALEKEQLNSIFRDIEMNIIKNGYKINLPNEIFFLKTNGKGESGAIGYTRANYIVLKDDIFSVPADDLKHLIIHELFHIITRNNPNFRKEMYKIIGFEIANKIQYPFMIKSLKISNPDAIQSDSYIKLLKDSVPIECMMILYSNKIYDGGDFFDYLKVGFLKLSGTTVKEIEYSEGKPVIYSFEEVTNFFEQVGTNTEYIIHPEEILADNFSFALMNKKDLPAQWIIEKIQEKLKQ